MNFSRDMKSLKNRRKGKAGFTMSELLIVVAIVIVLFAVAVLSLVTIQKNLRQKELDSKAEILYVAAQNRMSELRAGGYESLYQYDENKVNGVAKVGLIPLDAPEEDAEDAITKDTLCYVVSANRVEVGKAAASVLPESSVDAELWNNHWVIEYDPESGSVYSAFYSEEEITSGDVSTTLPTYLNRMRVRQTRLHNGAKIGYYGGARVISGTTDTLKPDISIDNREKLTATFYCNNPYADELTFNIKVSDGQNEYVKVVKYSELRQLNSKTWYYTWVMDSLESEKTRFYNQTDHKLACGTDITVTLSVESQNANVDGKSYTRKTNSLFRYAEDTPAGTALIAYGRHLQNLDEASHVSDTITGAVQVSDLSFADDTADNEDWYSFYGDTFTPITNKNLKSYDGYSEVDNVKLYSSISNLHITKAAQNGDAGLFSTFNGEIKNVTLTGMRIDNGGQNVGALIGSLIGAVVIVIVGQLGYVAAVSGLVMAICTLKGYEMLGKKLGTPGIIISCALMLLMIFLAYQADWSITAAQFYETDFFTAFRAMMDLIKEGYVDSGDYFGGLAQVYLFAVIGAVPTIIAMAKGAKHMVTTAKMRSAYAPVSAPAAASAQMPVQPASSPTAPQNVEKDIEK